MYVSFFIPLHLQFLSFSIFLIFVVIRILDIWVFTHLTICRSSHQRCSVKKVVLKIFTKFTGKHFPFFGFATFKAPTLKIVYKKTDAWYIEWQRVVQRVVQRMTTSDTTSDKTSDNEWQQVIQGVIKNDNKWQRVVQQMKTNESE